MRGVLSRDACLLGAKADVAHHTVAGLCIDSAESEPKFKVNAQAGRTI